MKRKAAKPRRRKSAHSHTKHHELDESLRVARGGILRLQLDGWGMVHAAFDRLGKVVYVKADAGSDFLPSMAEARAALPK